MVLLFKNETISHSENKQPHIFDLSTKAYSNMQANRKNQSIIVNGESGAGKTEAVKLLTAHLVNLARSESNAGILDKVVCFNQYHSYCCLSCMLCSLFAWLCCRLFIPI